MIDLTVDRFLQELKQEIVFARHKFPSSDGCMNALTEEVGELAKAYFDEPWGHVWKEAIQVAAMACRAAVEGDETLLVIRQKRGNGDGPKCPYKGCENSMKACPPCALCYE